MQILEPIFPVFGPTRSISATRLFTLILLACLLAGTTTLAQLAGKGAISGIIADPAGAAIVNAKVTVTNVATGISVTTNSTNAGDYMFSNLDPGGYTITVAAQQFEIQHQENVNVNALETTTYSPRLTVGSNSETVTVSTAPPQLQTTNATLGGTLEAEMYSALPVEMGAFGSLDQRRATDFAYLLPGVQGNATSGGTTTNSGVINGVGARGGTTVLYVDGVPFTNASGEGDPRFVWSAISVDAVDQFQVQTNGYSALYQGEGVQNYTVKQGGNKYHGSVYEFFRNTALDTWGYFKLKNPVTGLPQKTAEHQDEYGFSLSGPVPIGSLRKKLFYFGNLNRYHETATHASAMTVPTIDQQKGDFSGIVTSNGVHVPIFDPNSQAACTAFYTYPCRYRFGFTHGASPGTATTPGSPQIATGAPVDVIPSIDPIAQKLQSSLAATVNAQLITGLYVNNYVASNLKGLDNWSTTHRVDYAMSASDTFTFLYAHGLQKSNTPVGFSLPTSNNLGPLPYNYGQAYAPRTDVDIIEETHVFSPYVINQLKYGFARYISSTTNANYTSQYAATAMGINGAPVGQAAGAFPIVSFSGIDAPTTFAGYTANIGAANSFELLDNVQWELGKHSITFGGMISWLQYTSNPAIGGSSPLTLSTSVNETANFVPNGSPNAGSLMPNTGVAYASFLLGQIDKLSFTQNAIQATHARFRPISGYIQDNWKVTDKLTLDLGLRYDFFPTYREKTDVMSFLDPDMTNPITGTKGALNFAGHGAGTCNCDTPVHNYFKNFGPRLGLAYQIDTKTVVRASYGVMYSQGNGVGGSSASAQGTGLIGYQAAPNFSASGANLSTAPLSGGVPAYAAPLGIASGPQYGTGYTTTAGYTGTPTTLIYGDPYLGGRAPQFINYSFGFQHQWTSNLTTNITYVGSQGHFLQPNGNNARGYWANQLDPKYLGLGSCLDTVISKLTASCQTALQQSGAAVPSWFNTSQQLSLALVPFPQYTVTDNYGNVGNAHYNALQASMNLHVSHGVTFMMNYLWSKSIDNDGTFRSGYAIPAAYSNQNRSFAADAIDRSISAVNQPHHFTFTGVEHLPFGKGRLGGGHAWERALFGGYEFSQIVQTFSGSPLAITVSASACQRNPAQTMCEPTLNPAFSGNPRLTKHWTGFGPNIVPSGGTTTPFGPFLSTSFVPAYTFGNAPRTAPWGLTGPGLFDMDISLRRSFPLHFIEGAKLNLQAELYNVTNFVQFGGIGTSFGTSNFGLPSSQVNNPRQAQISARVEF